MKHYTLAEHRTFCIESGIATGLVWHEVVKLGWMPDGIYHNPDIAFNPEYKAKEKARKSTPEYKAKDKVRRASPEYKATKKEWNKRRCRCGGGGNKRRCRRNKK